MPSKIWAALFIIIAVVAYDQWRSSQSFDLGYNTHKAESADIKDNADTEGVKNVETIIKWRTKEKVIYRDKIKNIYIKEDVTGCRDTKLVDMGISLH